MVRRPPTDGHGAANEPRRLATSAPSRRLVREVGRTGRGLSALWRAAGADQSEDRERVRSSGLGVCRVRREAMSSMTPISSSVKTCLVAAGGGDLVQQRSRRAAVGALVAVLGSQIGADECFQSRPIRGLRVEALPLGAQLVGEDVGDEILLGLEVGVKGAVRQAGVGHEGRHAGAVDAVLLEASPGRLDDPLRVACLCCLSYRATRCSSRRRVACISSAPGVLYYDRNAN